jgi:hypothetical protein
VSPSGSEEEAEHSSARPARGELGLTVTVGVLGGLFCTVKGSLDTPDPLDMPSVGVTVT